MPNTNSQTILQMPGIVNKMVKQATGRESVGNIDMNFVTVGQDKATVQHTIEFTSVATFVNNNQLPISVIAKITAEQEGTGDPSPTNVRNITGFDECIITHYGEDISDADTYTFTFPEDMQVVEGKPAYGGTLNVTTGVLTIDTGLSTLNGTENWVEYTNFNGYQLTLASMQSGTRLDGISNMLKNSKTSTAGQTNSMWLGVNTRILYVIGVYESMGATLEEFKSYLSDHNLQVMYPLETPITVQLTPTEIKSLIGENNIYADTGNVAVSYKSYIPVP